METDSILIPIVPWAYDNNLTPYENTCFDSEVEQYIENEILNPTRKIPLRVAKCIIVGPVSVGKTSLIKRLGANGYGLQQRPTIGIDYWIQKFEVLGTPFRLQIWDTAGLERYNSVTKSFYRDAQIVIMQFDLSRPQTLLELKEFVKDVLTVNQEERLLIFLVGSKKDLISEAQCRVLEKEAAQVAKQFEAEYWSVSSLTGKNVQNLFSRIAALAFLKMIKTEIEIKESFSNENSRLAIMSEQMTPEPPLKPNKKFKCCLCNIT
ncbi:ras-related protein Rab-36-like [Panonychus citri]|uniref:ras-related protein Rab-36-like n=1 Tax=Panonychus citri TaxID=50023 RepID=UPI002307D0C3|nr:ras-related protein Rab-36-like [Panonychus citri]XP_053206130.1 ras-related protein Rab-36-like [Panonychus citri]